MTITIIFCLLLATGSPSLTSNHRPMVTAAEFAAPPPDASLYQVSSTRSVGMSLARPFKAGKGYEVSKSRSDV